MNCDNIYWGYIFMNDKGEIKHELKHESTFLINHLKAMKELVYTLFVLNKSSRKKTKYKGFVSYHPVFDALEVWGMQTQKNTSLKDVKKMYSELENVALRLDKQYLAAVTDIDEKIMVRHLGWEKTNDKSNSYDFIKKLF